MTRTESAKRMSDLAMALGDFSSYPCYRAATALRYEAKRYEDSGLISKAEFDTLWQDTKPFVLEGPPMPRKPTRPFGYVTARLHNQAKRMVERDGRIRYINYTPHGWRISLKRVQDGVSYRILPIGHPDDQPLRSKV